MKGSLNAIASVAYKELLHIVRDRRILVLIITLPPLFTLLFGHAFEASARKHVPTVLQDRDQSEESAKLISFLMGKEAFTWEKVEAWPDLPPDSLPANNPGALVIPEGWGRSLNEGNTLPLHFILDGSDTNTASELEGRLREALGQFKLSQRDEIVANLISELPDSIRAAGKDLPVEVRDQLAKKAEATMQEWPVQSVILYNPQRKFIDYVIPGIIGLILQLLTVTLMACTITREREAGTLSQLMVTSLHRREIVIGKVLPYLVVSMFLILMTIGVAHFHFGVKFRDPLALGLICFLFLLCSLGLGLLISAFCNTQTQAIQFAVFFLLPVFPLSGAFAPIERLPAAIRLLSQTFPLTHFCHAFRAINLRHASFSFIIGDLVFLLIGALLTCGGAAILLKRADE